MESQKLAEEIEEVDDFVDNTEITYDLRWAKEKLREVLNLFISNLNEKDSGWRLISYKEQGEMQRIHIHCIGYDGYDPAEYDIPVNSLTRKQILDLLKDGISDSLLTKRQLKLGKKYRYVEWY